MSIKASVYGWVLLGLSISHGSLVLAAEYGYYPSQDNRSYTAAGMPDRWRPLEQDEVAKQARDSAQSYQDRLSSSPQYQDYTDIPYGLPRGVYRPVEERHNITPHHQGYRFRPLTPNEQVKVRKRNTDHQNELRRSTDLAHPSYGQIMPGGSALTGQQSLRFRPDKRLPSMSENPMQNFRPDPEFTELYPPTLFRPLHN
ncbi:MAG: hypothetical protein ABW101_14805 [Candidatus Thiodiazotropha sp.]